MPSARVSNSNSERSTLFMKAAVCPALVAGPREGLPQGLAGAMESHPHIARCNSQGARDLLARFLREIDAPQRLSVFRFQRWKLFIKTGTRCLSGLIGKIRTERLPLGDQCLLGSPFVHLMAKVIGQDRL